MFQVGKAGFRISFPNGYTVEANIGPGSECSNKHERTLAMCQNREGQLICANAQMAVFKTGSNDVVSLAVLNVPDMYKTYDEKGLQWASPTAFAALVAYVAALPSIVESDAEAKPEPEPEPSGISSYGAIDMGYEP